MTSSVKDYLDRFAVDRELHRNLTDATSRVLRAVNEDGVRDMAIAFSGGKDSTALLIVMAELAARELAGRVRLRVVFSDTKLELPPLVDSAFSVLSRFRAFCKEHDVDYVIHLSERPLDQSFWVLMLGKGYPPPNRYFRWCTDRLKIQPPREVFRQLSARAALFTGVRSDESQSRAKSIERGCSAEGECGLERWTDDENREGLRFYAPLLDWRTCKVWDFLSLWAKRDGWPVAKLLETYGTSATRFGCWTCTLVDEDKALAQVTQSSDWEHLKPLGEFRRSLLNESRKAENRLHRSTGAKGKLSLTYRKRLLADLLALQEEVGRPLISLQEVKRIKELWQENLPAEYTRLVPATTDTVA